jgi:hypothetical protein
MNARWRGTGPVMAEPATPAESQNYDSLPPAVQDPQSASQRSVVGRPRRLDLALAQRAPRVLSLTPWGGYREIIGKIEDSRVKPDELAGIFTNFRESPPGLPN